MTLKSQPDWGYPIIMAGVVIKLRDVSKEMTIQYYQTN